MDIDYDEYLGGVGEASLNSDCESTASLCNGDETSYD